MAAVMTAPDRPAPAVRAGAGMRLLRAAVFTAVCVLLAAAGHSLASGGPVPVSSLALGWIGVFAFVVPLAGRERRLPGIAALLAAGQLALHLVFSTGQMCASLTAARGSGSTGTIAALAARLVCGGGASVPLTPQAARQVVARAGLDPSALAAPGRMAGMPMHAHPGFGAAHPVTALSMMLSMCSLPMLLGHLAAAVVAGLVLRRGEAALWRLVRLSVRGAATLSALAPSALRRARALLRALAGHAPYAAGHRARGAARTPAARLRTVWLRHSMARRGPPVVALAA